MEHADNNNNKKKNNNSSSSIPISMNNKLDVLKKLNERCRCISTFFWISCTCKGEDVLGSFNITLGPAVQFYTSP